MNCPQGVRCGLGVEDVTTQGCLLWLGSTWLGLKGWGNFDVQSGAYQSTRARKEGVGRSTWRSIASKRDDRSQAPHCSRRVGAGSQATVSENTPWLSTHGRFHPLKGHSLNLSVPTASRAMTGVWEQMMYFLKAFVEVEASVRE